MAKAAGAASAWGLTHILHRSGANFPGKIGLCLDPAFIAHLRPRIREGSVVVAGTNGKTTVANLMTDSLEAAGKTVACNRTGANLDSGIATALLAQEEADWGVLECDELWLPRVLPQLQPDILVLLNLFRDQLDRMGEIEHIQEAIAVALSSSPHTMLVYNCDDPLCQAVANRVGNKTVAFGISENLGLAQNDVADSGLCQACGSSLEYAWRQFGQLGAYRCPTCGFMRAQPGVGACWVDLAADGVSFTAKSGTTDVRIRSSQTGAYSVYNLLAVCAAAQCCNVPLECVARASERHTPDNGRQQHYIVNGARLLLNLAKNPAGMNQNLEIVKAEPGPKAAAFFINDKEADGRDVSWLWDADFQKLATCEDLAVFAGGMRRNDLQVRLKHAGLNATLVDGARDFVDQALAGMPGARLFLIANYTALPGAKAELDSAGERLPGSRPPLDESRIRKSGTRKAPLRRFRSHIVGNRPKRHRSTEQTGTQSLFPQGAADPAARSPESRQDCNEETIRDEPLFPGANRETRGFSASVNGKPLVIAHLFPELLNLYGDGGNVRILENRARRRGIEVQVERFEHGSEHDFADADIVFLGGGPDSKQRLASAELLRQADALRAYVEDDGVLLAICGGFQILGRTWILGDEEVEGLGILDAETKRAKGGSRNRIVGNVALRSPLADLPVIGYENHAGRTYLGPGCTPFGQVMGRRGKGNNDRDRADGALYRNVVATYLHGPLLAKNPQVADFLIERALARRALKGGIATPAGPLLAPLDDSAEHAANAFMCKRMRISLGHGK